MSGHSTYKPSNGFTRWMDERLPIIRLGHDAGISYPTPRNLNYWWTFGGILTMCLVVQILTGIILAMHYVPSVTLAFNSIEHIMRDVNYGWLIRYIHMNGASMFFIAVYIHMFRGLYYGSYKAPREVLWILGVVIYLLMMATAFFGYVLPWGQMSFWGATVITNLFGAIPLVGEGLRAWLWGGFSVGDPTLNRFFSLHYLFPFLIFGVVILHIWALHVVGQNNPAGIEPKDEQDTVPFTPYATVKDGFGMVLFLILFAYFVFYNPNGLGESVNYLVANPLSTPAHIVPEWYLLPFYAILRAVPDKLGGVILMFGAIAVLFFLPWLDTSKVRSARFRPLFKQFFWLHVVVCLTLGWIGAQEPGRVIYQSAQSVGTYASNDLAQADITSLQAQPGNADTNYIVEHHLDESSNVMSFEVKKVGITFDVTDLGRILAFYYFFHFLVLFPLLGLIEKTKPLPESISASVLGAHAPSKAA